MTSKERKSAHGGAKATDLWLADPDELVLVTDEKSPLYDERVHLPFDEASVEAMIMYRTILPVICIKNQETGKFEVDDGRQRVTNAREANKRIRKKSGEPLRVPYTVKRMDAGTSVAVMLLLNELRRPDAPLNMARKCSKMLELGKTEEEVATAIGKSVATLKNMLRLIDAPAAVRNAVDAGKIAASDGYKLAKLEPEEARKKVAELIEHAPRTPGKKRSKNAKKAREIVSGKKPAPLDRNLPDFASTSAASGAMRSENQVENLKRELENQDRCPEVVSALAWVLGGDVDLEKTLGVKWH